MLIFKKKKEALAFLPKLNSELMKVAKTGIIKKENAYFLRLYNGGITNLNNEKTFTLNFSETDYDLSNFSTKGPVVIR